MKQQEFIWVAKKFGGTEVIQDEIGNTTISLRPQIKVIHNYKKKDQMQIVFTEDQARYLIPGNDEFKQIVIINVTDGSSEHDIRAYCEKTLKKI